MAKVRVEWVRLARQDYDRGAVSNDLGYLVSAQTLIISSTAVTSAAAPSFANSGDATQPAGFARVTAISGAVNVAWGAAPTASESFGARIESGGEPLLIPMTTGQFLSIIEAVDPPSTADVQDHAVIAEATSRSAIIAAGGTAQDLMAANSARRGWEVQNQGTTNLYVRSKGSAGTTVATADQNSLLIPPGALYTADAHVTPNALSIIGPTTGQIFYAREW